MRAFIARHGAFRWAVNFALILALAGAGFWQYGQATQAERALCALRQDVERRAHNAEKYLEDVKAGRRERVQGITDAEIRDGIRNQRRTIGALAGLDCSNQPTV